MSDGHGWSRSGDHGADGTTVCRNVTVSGRRTSLRMEPELWQALEEIADREGTTIHALCTLVDRRRGAANLTGSVRVAIVAYFRLAAAPVCADAPDAAHAPGSTPAVERAVAAVAPG